MKRGLNLKYEKISELGYVRETNQDRVIAIENDYGFLGVVCDGIGGGRAGDVASELVVSIFEEAFLSNPKFEDDADMIAWFEKTLAKANLAVFNKSMKSKAFHGMGTTIVAVLIYGGRALGFNVGDSRLYELRHGNLNLLSHDQTYAYQMYLQNEITKEEIAHHPRRNVLINAVGIKDEINFETIRVVDGWQNLMLSTDGLHDFVDHGYLEQAFNLPLDKAAELLKSLALKAGGYDNISFVLIEGNRHE